MKERKGIRRKGRNEALIRRGEKRERERERKRKRERKRTLTFHRGRDLKREREEKGKDVWKGLFDRVNCEQRTKGETEA